MTPSDQNDILSRAKALLGSSEPHKVLGNGSAALSSAKAILERPAGSLDVYINFDTTGSMGTYIEAVKDNLARVTDALLGSGSTMRISMNGIGDHCDGENWVQLYALSADPAEVQGALENIAMTGGGDEPEAYECLAVALVQRIPTESAGRKRAVVLVGDSVPHGMIDEPCLRNIDYQRAFAGLKTLCDGFYLVGCNQETYAQQRTLIDPTKPHREQFIPLGSMVDVLPDLLVALAKKTESAKALGDYMKLLTAQDAEKATRIAGLLGAGNR